MPSGSLHNKVIFRRRKHVYELNEIAVYILSEIPFYYSLPFSVRLIE